VSTPRADRQVVALDALTRDRVEVPLGDAPVVSPIDWSVYVSSVARRLSRDLEGLRRGVTVTFASDLPRAAGLSSSSALVVSLLLALACANDLPGDPRFRSHVRGVDDLAIYASCVESGRSFGAWRGESGVGTHGGSEDHVAMLCCRPGRLDQVAFDPFRRERSVRLEAGWTFVVAVSGVAAEKTGAARHAYNRLAADARRLLDVWRAATGRADATLGAAMASAPYAADRLRALVRGSSAAPRTRDRWLGRLDQFLEESGVIVPAVTAALARRSVSQVGRLVDRSQASAAHLLLNQVPETVALARMARRLGAAAASAFGAGFGGSVWALVRASQATTFSMRWADAYAREFPMRQHAARFFTTRPGPAAVGLEPCDRGGRASLPAVSFPAPCPGPGQPSLSAVNPA
jgi:galactokinase